MVDVKVIQSELRASKIDGWLFYDHHRRDPIANIILKLGGNGLASRRWFYLSLRTANRESWSTASKLACSIRSTAASTSTRAGKNFTDAAEIAFRQQNDRHAIFARK